MGEVVVRNLQFHRPLEELNIRWVELSVREELESRAEGAVVVDDDDDELLHHWFGMLHQFGEPASHHPERRQRKFCLNRGPVLSADRLAV